MRLSPTEWRALARAVRWLLVWAVGTAALLYALAVVVE